MKRRIREFTEGGNADIGQADDLHPFIFSLLSKIHDLSGTAGVTDTEKQVFLRHVGQADSRHVRIRESNGVYSQTQKLVLKIQRDCMGIAYADNFHLGGV